MVDAELHSSYSDTLSSGPSARARESASHAHGGLYFLRLNRLFERSLHNDEEDSAFVPAAEPDHSPFDGPTPGVTFFCGRQLRIFHGLL